MEVRYSTKERQTSDENRDCRRRHDQVETRIVVPNEGAMDFGRNQRLFRRSDGLQKSVRVLGEGTTKLRRKWRSRTKERWTSDEYRGSRRRYDQARTRIEIPNEGAMHFGRN